MSESSHPPDHQPSLPPPPPAPPLPPPRFALLQRIIAPVGFGKTPQQSEARGSPLQRPPIRTLARSSGYGSLPSQTLPHRTSIPISALDINQQKTHAILAGKEILKTVRIQDGKVTEDFNLRSSIISYASTHGSSQADAVNRRREYLPARDVRWSSKHFSHIIATAAQNGRISLYDVNVIGSRTELAWLHEHSGQVNKIDFDVFVGYLMLSGSSDKTVKMWDIRDTRSPKCTQTFEVRSGVRHVAWSPVEGNDFEFAICADGGLVQHWDARNPKGPTLIIHAHDRGCYSFDWHPDGRHVVSGGFDKYVRVWDLKGERRQKPVFNLRAPQAVRNVKWRPPCWSSETTKSGAWQTTQVATTYNVDDPRMHVWDLRRPMIPFREIDMYNKPATDFLWASKDLIWTCGEEGMFTQNDVNFLPQTHETFPTCAMKWLPNGDSVIFSEERVRRRTSAGEDASAAFLNVAAGKMSGSDDASRQRSPEEDDHEDGPVDGLLSTSFKRRGRGIPTKSLGTTVNTSLTGSPQTPDNLYTVLQLDKAVQHTAKPFQNKQTGFIGSIPGATTEPEVVEFLANHYAPPPLDSERQKDPGLILQRLKNCFLSNADVCDEASMHRMAQSWRILESIIIPELSEWVDGNRAQRKSEALEIKKRREQELRKVKEKETSIQSFSRLQARNEAAGQDTKPQKLISGLFKGVTDSDKLAFDNDSSSNVATPLARPIPGSPRPSRTGHKSGDSDNFQENIDDLQALPPSLLNSHATAAAAARALADNVGLASSTPPTSPDQERKNEESLGPAYDDDKPESPQRIVERSPLTSAQKQEEKRAALRDYRAQARPIFSLDAPIRSPQYSKGERHDSSESFPMFSASTSSSHRIRSLVRSSDSPDYPHPSVAPKRGLPTREDSLESISSLDDDSPQKDNVQIRDFSDSPSDPSSGKRDGPDPGLAYDGSFESKVSTSVDEYQTCALEDSERAVPDSNVQHGAISPSLELFHFEASYSPPRTKIHITNPILEPSELFPGDSVERPSSETRQDGDIETDGYLFRDFRPIDLSKYDPKLPFAFSALPLACQMIAYDSGSGVACGQFAAHLLLYLAPYFWHRDSRKSVCSTSTWPKTMAERLMRPDLSHRILESVMVDHLRYIEQMKLYVSSARLRQTCAELGFERALSVNVSEAKGSSLNTGDVYAISTACSFCRAPMKHGRTVCDQCRRSRAVCPLCTSVQERDDSGSASKSRKRPLWTCCQACGHSAHNKCMAEWLSLTFSEGRCPTVGCGCDCAPGKAREERFTKQRQDHEESRLIGGRLSSTKKDPYRAIQSPAVDKTRAALRASSGERATQSSDERGKPGRRSSTRQSGGGFASSRKSVRLVTPGEERTSSSTTTPQTKESTSRLALADRAPRRG